jgi:hypothetical protein
VEELEWFSSWIEWYVFCLLLPSHATSPPVIPYRPLSLFRFPFLDLFFCTVLTMTSQQTDGYSDSDQDG